MAKQKKKPFDKLYAQLEDVKDSKGNYMNTVIFNRYGTWSVAIEIENPVQQYCTEAAQYYAYTDVLNSIVQTLGRAIACRSRTSSAASSTAM